MDGTGMPQARRKRERLTMVTVRRATADDIDALVPLRLALLREAGEAAVGGEVADATRAYLRDTLPTGGFVAWVAEAEGRVVSTSGMMLFRRPPSWTNASGREAYVMNMYTEPAWRGQGLATALLGEIIAFVRATDARRIWLHATPAGRPVYEKAGFVAHHGEMELTW